MRSCWGATSASWNWGKRMKVQSAAGGMHGDGDGMAWAVV